jgi:hypothetical protein
MSTQGVQQARAVPARHVNVAQDQIGKILPGHLQARGAGIGLDDAIAFPAKNQGERGAQRLIVIDNQNGFHSGKNVWLIDSAAMSRSTSEPNML